jgi:maltose O-acetyltransferase
MKSIKQFVKLLFWKIIRPEEILEKVEQLKIDQCVEKVTLGDDSAFYSEAMVNNFSENRELIQIGLNTHIRGELTLYAYSNGILVGDNSYIGAGSIIRSGDKVTIGSNVLISHNVTIIDSDSHELDHLERTESYRKLLKVGLPREKGNVKTAPVIIEDYVWISYNVSVLKGVTIGTGAIIGASSVVTEDIPSFCIAAGNPAKVIKQIIK